MKFTKVSCGQGFAALAEDARGAVSDVQSALDMMMTAKYETGCEALILPKEALPEEFFILSTGLAGEVLQKFVNYHIKLAIVGDFSRYTSKPLRDFIRESNCGSRVFL